MALLPGSPAIGGGTSTGAPALDQRGEPRAGHVDIGAFQSQGFILQTVAGSSSQSAAVNSAFAIPLTVRLTALNPIEPVNGGVVSYAVTPSGGALATLSAATATIAGGKASVTATANATIGQYVVSATVGGAGPVGFVLTNTEAPSLTVTTRSDVVDATDGLTSLREAINYANSHPGPDTITLDPAAFGKRHRAIVLTGGPLVLTDPATTTITGPGAKRLKFSGGGKSRVFDIQGGSLALSGVTIADGRADRGGGTPNQGGT
jgi:fibronectin-binding autotransporter adhesin